MRDYSYTELGMLIGTSVGGALSIIAFALYHDNFVFIIAALGTVAGLLTGNILNKKYNQGHNSGRQSFK